MHVWPSDGQNSQICTTFPVVKCVFLKSPWSNAYYAIFWFTDSHCRGYTFTWAWHVPVYTEAQCCFKSLALRSCQCGRKTRYELEFWSLRFADGARVNFLGRVPALVGWQGYLNPKSGSPASILGSPAIYSKKAKRFSFPLFMLVLVLMLCSCIL